MKKQPKCDFCSKIFNGTQNSNCYYANSSSCEEAGRKYYEIQRLKALKQNTHTHNINKNVKVKKTKRYN